MNCDDGHLVKAELLERMSKNVRVQYEPVPPSLSIEAKLELMGKEETFVGKEASGSLSKYMREKRRKKLRRQLAKLSKKKNREQALETARTREGE